MSLIQRILAAAGVGGNGAKEPASFSSQILRVAAIDVERLCAIWNSRFDPGRTQTLYFELVAFYLDVTDRIAAQKLRAEERVAFMIALVNVTRTRLRGAAPPELRAMAHTGAFPSSPPG